LMRRQYLEQRDKLPFDAHRRMRHPGQPGQVALSQRQPAEMHTQSIMMRLMNGSTLQVNLPMRSSVDLLRILAAQHISDNLGKKHVTPWHVRVFDGTDELDWQAPMPSSLGEVQAVLSNPQAPFQEVRLFVQVLQGLDEELSWLESRLLELMINTWEAGETLDNILRAFHDIVSLCRILTNMGVNLGVDPSILEQATLYSLRSRLHVLLDGLLYS